jgi:hypothetical protein
MRHLRLPLFCLAAALPAVSHSAAIASPPFPGRLGVETSADAAQAIAITRLNYRIKDHAAIAVKEDKNKRSKSKPDEPSTAEPAG